MNKKKKNFFHGIMFHHFHDKKNFLKSQGSISKEEFLKIIEKIGIKNILNADLFEKQLYQKKIKSNQVCLTFDDGLLCQYKIVYPLLRKLKIKAFWFVYTSIFTNKPSPLEIYREFRNNYFKDINEFYNFFFSDNFFIKNKEKFNKFKKKIKKEIKFKKKIFPFYSNNDLLFRLTRDQFLSQNQYVEIMKRIMKTKKVKTSKIIKKLFIKKKHIVEMKKNGQVFGLHSHNHPTNINKLNYKDQINEYKINLKYLKKITKTNITCMSHPCGEYNKKLLNFFLKKKITLGFKSNMSPTNNKINSSNLEIAREDHSNLII